MPLPGTQGTPPPQDYSQAQGWRPESSVGCHVRESGRKLGGARQDQARREGPDGATPSRGVQPP